MQQMKERKRFGKVTTAFSLVGLALGFILLGIEIIAKANSEGFPIVGGVVGICLGTAFLWLAFHYRRYATLGS
jgi:Na+/melibiose symporter-like transporter